MKMTKYTLSCGKRNVEQKIEELMQEGKQETSEYSELINLLHTINVLLTNIDRE